MCLTLIPSPSQHHPSRLIAGSGGQSQSAPPLLCREEGQCQKKHEIRVDRREAEEGQERGKTGAGGGAEEGQRKGEGLKVDVGINHVRRNVATPSEHR